MTALQTQMERLNLMLQDKEHELELGESKLRAGDRNLESMQKFVGDLNSQLESTRNQKLKLIDQKEELKRKGDMEREEHHLRIQDIVKDVKFIKDFISPTAEEPNLQEEMGVGGLGGMKNEDENALIRIQQEELEVRNEEIQRLRTILGGSFVSSEQANLKNTIKHLKGELNRYSKMIKGMIERSCEAEKAIEEYTSTTKRCEN